MTFEQEQERDRRDCDIIVISDIISKLNEPLYNTIKICREEGFTWSEIGFEFFKKVQEIMNDVKQNDIKEHINL